MKFKVLTIIVAVVAAIFLMGSCSDTVDSIGESIQPGSDDIIVEIDSILLTAQTVELQDRFYTNADKILLGMITDPVFGTQKADFLTEFFCANAVFLLGDDGKVNIDSVVFDVVFANGNFLGDSVKPMAVTIYELTENLKSDFYTDINTDDYCDKKTILGQRFFSFQNLFPVAGGKLLEIDVDKSYGQKLFDKWKSDVDAGKEKTVLHSIETLREFMKGIYVTSDFSREAMIEASYASEASAMRIYYSINLIKKHSTTNIADSTVGRVLPFPIGGAEAIKINHITNSSKSEIMGDDQNQIAELNKVKSYLRSPAGVVTQINIPLKKIKEKGIKKIGSDGFNINSAVFKLTGLTEEENKLTITKRPSALLFINKDSIHNFFSERKILDNMHAYTKVIRRDGATNTYDFVAQNLNNSLSNNLASLINHYLEKEEEIETLEYLLIPLEYETPAQGQTVFLPAIENQYSSSAAILRTSEEFMKMSLIFTKHKGVSGNKSIQ